MKNATHVVGFLFSEALTHVLLIRKARPTWQHGKLNGIGGKVEAGETPIEAMRREFYEETGYTGAILWCLICNYDCPSHSTVMDFYCGESDEALYNARNPDASEPLVRVSLTRGNRVIKGEPSLSRDTFEREAIPNLTWLIPMALNRLNCASDGYATSFDMFSITEVS